MLNNLLKKCLFLLLSLPVPMAGIAIDCKINIFSTTSKAFSKWSAIFPAACGATKCTIFLLIIFGAFVTRNMSLLNRGLFAHSSTTASPVFAIKAEETLLPKNKYFY